MTAADPNPRTGFVSSIAASCAGILLLSTFSWAAQPAIVSSYSDPRDLVRKTVQNEINADRSNSSHFFFRGVKTTPKDSTTRLYVESKEATAGMLVAYNGKPLSAQQREAEEARIARFLNHPEELNRKHNQEQEELDHMIRIMRALPDAFLFEYAGEEPASEHIGHLGDTLVKLKFHPNPTYQPPSHVEEVLTGMDGYLLIDAVRFRLASIDATLFKEVGFGWGILGHLNSGGRFVVQQQEVGDNQWEISSMTLNFTGKILVFKNLSIKSTEVFSDFKPVSSNLSFAQAVDLLRKEESSATAGNCCAFPAVAAK